jgi:hypothetical protein
MTAYELDTLRIVVLGAALFGLIGCNRLGWLVLVAWAVSPWIASGVSWVLS